MASVVQCECCVFRSISWEDSVHYYDEAAAQDTHDEGGEYDSAMDDPVYILKAKQAELLRAGGNGLDKNPERAGRLVCLAYMFK